MFKAKIIIGRKPPAKVFGLVTVKVTKTNIILPLWPLYYMPQNPQNTLIQTVLKK